jgi:hypothetical protein
LACSGRISVQVFCVVVENERDELYEWALGVIAFRIGAAGRGRRTGAATTEKCEEILLKDQTEDQ